MPEPWTESSNVRPLTRSICRPPAPLSQAAPSSWVPISTSTGPVSGAGIAAPRRAVDVDDQRLALDVDVDASSAAGEPEARANGATPVVSVTV